MKEIYIPTNKNADRPIVYLQQHGNLRALLDSGARFPVWMSDITSLIALGAKLFKNDVKYAGVGGQTVGDIYKIPTFVLGDRTSSLIFPELPVVTNTEFAEAPFELLLSNTMFNNLDYLISNKRHSVTIYLDDTDSNVRNAIVNLNNGFQVLFTGENNIV